MIYTNLEKKLDSCMRSEGEALIMVGKGTTFFGKTVDMIWKYEEMEELRDYFKRKNMGYVNNKKSKPFPISRLLWNDGGYWKPIGWASLEISS